MVYQWRLCRFSVCLWPIRRTLSFLPPIREQDKNKKICRKTYELKTRKISKVSPSPEKKSFPVHRCAFETAGERETSEVGKKALKSQVHGVDCQSVLEEFRSENYHSTNSWIMDCTYEQCKNLHFNSIVLFTFRIFNCKLAAPDLIK